MWDDSILAVFDALGAIDACVTREQVRNNARNAGIYADVDSEKFNGHHG